MDCNPVSVELTYGMERLAMFLQGIENVYDLAWNERYTYGDIQKQAEVEWSRYNFDIADTVLLFQLFDQYEAECRRILAEKLVLPAYDYVLKCSHIFNLLDARRAISVTERTGFIARVRQMARGCAAAYLQQREEMGFPLLSKDGEGGAA
jgi:glycyl-tRNA synthetase alpha chain